QNATFNFPACGLAPSANHMSATVDQVERPLVPPAEVMRLRPPTKSGHGAAERITAPGDMLIFVSGHFPIYGTQILYFTDPVLAKRAVLPPPNTFMAIEDHHTVSQQPADRTRNVISAAEPRTMKGDGQGSDERLTPMERAFLAGMGEQEDTATAAQSVTGGFIEQLDLDLHESENH